MAQKVIKFRGKAYWARVLEGQEDEYNDKQFYKITVVLDDESEAKFRKSGLRLQHKPVSSSDEDAPEGITFRRDLEPKIVKDSKTGKNKKLGGGLPKVTDSDGEKWDQDTEIGNESIVEVTVLKYDIPKRRLVGHRLEAVKVLEHVPYEPYSDEDDIEDEEEDQEVHAADEPKNSGKATSSKASPARSRKNTDDIPF